MTKNHQEIELNPYYIKERMKRGWMRIYRNSIIHSIQYAVYNILYIICCMSYFLYRTKGSWKHLWLVAFGPRENFLPKEILGNLKHEKISYILNRTQRTTQNLFLKSKCQNDGKMFSFGYIIWFFWDLLLELLSLQKLIMTT